MNRILRDFPRVATMFWVFSAVADLACIVDGRPSLEWAWALLYLSPVPVLYLGWLVVRNPRPPEKP